MFLAILLYVIGIPLLFKIVSFLLTILLENPILKIFTASNAKYSLMKHINGLRMSFSAAISTVFMARSMEIYLHVSSFILLIVAGIIVFLLGYAEMTRMYHYICSDKSCIPDSSLSDSRNEMLRQQTANSTGAHYILGLIAGLAIPVFCLYKHLNFWW